MGTFFENINSTVAIIVAAIIIVLVVILYIYKSSKFRKQKKYVSKIQKELQAAKTRLYDLELNKETLETRINDLTSAKEQLAKVAYYDYLTGLPNRNALINMLDGAMYTLRNEEIIILTIIDISDFKDINTSLGYPHGDELLIDVTHLLQEQLDENDYLTRYGADEFAVLTQNMNMDDFIANKLEKIQKAFERPFVLATKECSVNMNIGIALAPKDGKNTQQLMKNAESALNLAQNSDKNSYCFFDDSINTNIIKKLEIKSELRKAIEDNQFLVYYQVRVDLDTQKPSGLEALMRWKHPERGILKPEEFLSIAEESGLIVQIGELVLYQVCNFIKHQEEEKSNPLPVTVNISGREFRDKKFLTRIERCIKNTGIKPEHLELEVQEQVIISDFENAKHLTEELNKLGVGFSISDFGAGYSNMNYIKFISAGNLKISKEYLYELMQDEGDRKILELVINLAQAMNFNVIAVGVEASEQEELLKNVNCNMAQGYLYSEPLSEEGFALQSKSWLL